MLLASVYLVELSACTGDSRPARASRDDARADAAVVHDGMAVRDAASGSAGDPAADGQTAPDAACSPWPAVTDPGGCPSGSPGAPLERRDESLAGGFRVVRNLTYDTRGQRALQGDLFLPPESAGAAPGVLIVVHGGGWTDCMRRRQATEWYAAVMSRLLGVATFNIEYRLVQEGGAYPENLRDVKCAVQWIATHAQEHGVDGSRLVIAGESAGGHLALMAGLTKGRADLDPACGDAPPQVDGVIAFSAPTDLPALVAQGTLATAAVTRYAGACEDPVASPCSAASTDCDRCVDASPVSHACESTAHFVLVQAADPFDPLIPESQARRLANALDSAAIPNDLVVVDPERLRAEGCEAGVFDRRTPHGLLNGQTCLTTPSGAAVERLVRSALLP